MQRKLTAAENAERSDEMRQTFPEMRDGADALVGALIAASLLDDDLTVSQWADRYRYIGPESGSRYPGKWRTDRVPYCREPTDCLHPDHPARKITLKWSAQTGKSEIGVNFFGFIVDRAPASILTVLPTGEEAKKYNRVKLQPTIDASPQIRKRVAPENSRDELASTTGFKRFAGGFNQITTATSSKGLQMISVRYLILDEASGYPRDVDGRGSPIAQARARTKSYADTSKELMPSTPGIAGECIVSEQYEGGDRRLCYLPCPHCGTYQPLRYESMQPPVEATDFRVTFACVAPECGRSFDQTHLAEMETRLRWVPTWVEDGESPVPGAIPAIEIGRFAIPPCSGRVRHRQPSWALWSAYSQMERWGDIWQRGEDAKGDPLKERTFFQQDLGIAYEPKTDVPDAQKLLAVRKSWPRGSVPRPASVNLGFIDVQGNRFEWGVWAFGPGFEGWLVDRGVIGHSYQTEEAWRAIDALTSRAWPGEGGKPLPVLQWGIDTGTFTQALYDRVSQRPLLLATKGANRPGAAPFTMSRADLRDERGTIISGRQIDLGHIGNFDLKMSVYDGLRHLVEGPDEQGQWQQGTLHLPDWIGEDELKQLTAEVLVDPREEVKGKGKKLRLIGTGDRREWKKIPRQPNEGLDIVVGCRALAWAAGAGQLTREQWMQRAAEAHEAPMTAPAGPELVAGRDSVAKSGDVFDRFAALNDEV